MFRDAALRTIQAVGIIGVRGMPVDAASKQAKGFYVALGMTESPLDSMTIVVTLADLKANLAAKP